MNVAQHIVRISTPNNFLKKLELMLAIIFITIPPTLASQGTEFLATCQFDIQEWSP